MIPLEIKVKENLKAKSLKSFYDKYHSEHSVRTSMLDYREQDWMDNIALYGIKRIQKYL